MAFQNNQRFNNPDGQQQYPGMGSPYAVAPMMPGQTMPGTVYGQSPVAQHSPMNVSMPGFMPICQSSPVSQINTPAPTVNQGPHMRLFTPTGTNPQPQMPMTRPPVVPWGAGAVMGPSYQTATGQGIMQPHGNTNMQPGMFVPPPFPPPVPPPVPVSQSNAPNFNNNLGAANQMPGNVQGETGRYVQESFAGSKRDYQYSDRDRDRYDEKQEKFEKREKGHHSDRHSDRRSNSDRREARGHYSSRRGEQHTGRHKQEDRSRREDRRSYSKDRSRDRSHGSEARDSSSDSSHHSYRRNRHTDNNRQRHSARPPDDFDAPGSQRLGRTGAVLLEDRDGDVGMSVGRSGAVLLEDMDDGDTRSIVGKTGAILKEDRNSESPLKRERDDRRYDQQGRGRERRGFHGNRGHQGSRSSVNGTERDHSRESSRERSRTRERDRHRSRVSPPMKLKTEDGVKEREATLDERLAKEGDSVVDVQPSTSGYDKWKLDQEEKKRQIQEIMKLKSGNRFWDALEEEETEEMSEEAPEETPAWVRCSAADLYYTKDLKTGCTFSTKKMQDLERRFENELVLCNERARKKFPPREEVTKSWRDYFHFHEEDSGSSSDSDSDDEVKTQIMEEWMTELKRKQEHPQRLHTEVWHNEAGMLNGGPLCRCSLKHRKTGIRHSKYPGEEPVPLCDPSSNNKDKLYHYRISMAPTTNILTKTPSLINHDNHEYMFEGFSIFTHSKITEKMPLCKLMRFSIVYTVYTIDEIFPENFSVRSLDLFTRYLFTEILELIDMDWKGPGDETSCQRFHLMPRFARPLPENGKEILSMNQVLLYFLQSKTPLIDPVQLPQLLKLNQQDWANYVDDFRGSLVTCYGMKPTALRIDQLDKNHCEENDGGSITFPYIVHCGVRPAQLSYCGDPEYKRKWREYMKLRHLYTNRPKMTALEKEKLEDAGEELAKIRSKSSKKRDVTIEISAEGFYRTGIRTDLSQHALFLPVLFDHLRFHFCLHLFEEQIGYVFKDRYLLQLAFTHSSYKVNFGTNPDHVRNSLSNCGNRMVEMGDIRNNFKHTKKKGLSTLIKIMSKFGYKQEMKSEVPHNERLEWLGDSVVEFLSSVHLYFMFPYHDEGEMTTYRGSLVANKNLTLLAKKIHLEDYMLFAHGIDLCEELTMKHAMADCFEALIGAMMLDTGMLEGGLEQADEVFAKCLFDDPVLLDVWNTLPEHPLQAEEPDGDRHWIESSPALQSLVKFEESIGLEFHHIRLLARSFCQNSHGFNNLTYGNNQRLEFLGDTIIQLISSEYLYKHFPAHHEGHLTLLRSCLVNNRTQATVCEELGMTDYLINSNPQDARESAQNKLKLKHKADLLEALLGALYVDGGLEFPKALVEVCFIPRLEEFILNQDWNDPKSQLQQCCLVLRNPDDEEPDLPVYKIVNVVGPSNTRRYTVAVYFQGQRLATGTNYAIQTAEMEAAAKALIDHKDRFLLPLFEYGRWFGENIKVAGSRSLKDFTKGPAKTRWTKK